MSSNNNIASLKISNPQMSQDSKAVIGGERGVNGKLKNKFNQHLTATNDENGFLSTSPDSANGETLPHNSTSKSLATVLPCCSTTENHSSDNSKSTVVPPPVYLCTNSKNCVTLKNILDSFKAPLSEEQAWALIYQFISMYKQFQKPELPRHIFSELEIPDAIENVNLHVDGTVHCSWSDAEWKKKEQKIKQEKEQQQQFQQQGGDEQSAYFAVDDNLAQLIASHKKILRKVAVIVYTALDYNLQSDEQCQMSHELEELITHMTAEDSDDDCIDEGIEEGYKRWDDESEDDKTHETKEFDYVLEICKNHIKPTIPEDHYKAVCRALVAETIELRVFLQQVLNEDIKADSPTAKKELAKLGFNDWARFWVQVIDELRRGVRLKKNNYSRAPIEYELTPYEILMEDIRSKKYQLRKVMVNGDIPPRVKKDAHALILEFIRSRPPLKKASERELPPPIKRTPSPREQLMDSIRQGRQLKHIQPPIQPRLKDKLLPSNTTSINNTTSSSASSTAQHALQAAQMETHTTTRSKQRLIKVDFSLLQDDDHIFDDDGIASTSNSSSAATKGLCSQPQMPPYPIGGYMTSNEAVVNPKSTTTTAAPSTQVPATSTNRVIKRTNFLFPIRYIKLILDIVYMKFIEKKQKLFVK